MTDEHDIDGADEQPADERAGPPPERSFKRLSTGWSALASIVATIAVAITQAKDVAATPKFVLWVASLLALLVGAFQLTNSAYRVVKCKHADREVGARALLALEGGIGAGLTAVGLISIVGAPAPPVVLVVFFALAAPLYWLVEQAIAEKVHEAGRLTGTDHFGNSIPLRMLGSKVTVRKALAPLKDQGPGKFLKDLVKTDDDAAVVTISVARKRVTEVLVLIALLALAGTIGGVAGDRLRGDADKPHVESSAGRLGGQDAGDKETEQDDRVPDDPPVDPPPQPRPDESDPCGAQVEPGTGAPPWAAELLYDVYLGSGGPGLVEAGCTIKALEVSEEFVYQVGLGPDANFKSVAVASRRWEPAVFLTPATTPVLNLINRGVAFGGSNRRDRGNGDFYVIYTATGTRALVRSRKTPSGRPREAQPYVELPQVITELWVETMKESDRWLWPRISQTAASGVKTFVFDDIYHRARARVRFTPQDGTARWLDRGDPASITATGTKITDEDLIEISYR
jgi:hypothetical protein